jgi:hypothetical protein
VDGQREELVELRVQISGVRPGVGQILGGLALGAGGKKETQE